MGRAGRLFHLGDGWRRRAGFGFGLSPVVGLPPVGAGWLLGLGDLRPRQIGTNETELEFKSPRPNAQLQSDVFAVRSSKRSATGCWRPIAAREEAS